MIRAGDAVRIDLMLGNYGNHHRNYKLVSKIGVDGVVLKVRSSESKSNDIQERFADAGYAAKADFWTAKFAATTTGLYVVERSLAKVVSALVSQRGSHRRLLSPKNER